VKVSELRAQISQESDSRAGELKELQGLCGPLHVLASDAMRLGEIAEGAKKDVMSLRSDVEQELSALGEALAREVEERHAGAADGLKTIQRLREETKRLATEAGYNAAKELAEVRRAGAVIPPIEAPAGDLTHQLEELRRGLQLTDSNLSSCAGGGEAPGEAGGDAAVAAHSAAQLCRVCVELIGALSRRVNDVEIRSDAERTRLEHEQAQAVALCWTVRKDIVNETEARHADQEERLGTIDLRLAEVMQRLGGMREAELEGEEVTDGTSPMTIAVSPQEGYDNNLDDDAAIAASVRATAASAQMIAAPGRGVERLSSAPSHPSGGSGGGGNHSRLNCRSPSPRYSPQQQPATTGASLGASTAQAARGPRNAWGPVPSGGGGSTASSNNAVARQSSGSTLSSTAPAEGRGREGERFAPVRKTRVERGQQQSTGQKDQGPTGQGQGANSAGSTPNAPEPWRNATDPKSRSGANERSGGDHRSTRSNAQGAAPHASGVPRNNISSVKAGRPQ